METGEGRAGERLDLSLHYSEVIIQPNSQRNQSNRVIGFIKEGNFVFNVVT